MQSKVISLLILAAAAGWPALAATAPVDAPTSASESGNDMPGLENRWGLPLTFNSFDKDKDGYVSRQEARASQLLASQFDQLDKDGDGKLSLEELRAAVPDATAGANRKQANRGN